MTKHEAIKVILSDEKSFRTSLNYAVGYCQAALTMPEESEALRVRILYILNNINHWRHPEAKAVRAALRAK